jgi:hypothetical protein
MFSSSGSSILKQTHSYQAVYTVHTVHETYVQIFELKYAEIFFTIV